MTAYEDRLSQDSRWALNEGGLYFDEKSEVHKSLRKIADSLRTLGIEYSIVGGMALFRHGFRRFTEDVDVLVTEEGLKELHRQLDGRGYLPPFERSKNLRDTDNGVKIEFLVSGKYPGDGKPKPVAFPHPADVCEEHDGIQYVKLPTLVEMKLASGMTNSERMKDLSDVQELIKIMNLPIDFGDALNPYVRDKYVELWNASQPRQKRYVLIWRSPKPAPDATMPEDLHASSQRGDSTLQAMLLDGVQVDSRKEIAEDGVYLVTTDPDVARKYGMHDEDEFMDSE
ncbi:MAG: nucleotidyl transferase AbiEii/AbiGii toxin family protein [Planctomycetaceae bacterium]